MSDVENVPQTPTDDSESKHESDVPSDAQTIDTHEDNASVNTADELHEEGAEAPPVGEENGAPAGKDEAAAPAEAVVDSQEGGGAPKEAAAEPKKAAASDNKSTKKAVVSPKASPVKAARLSAAATPLGKKIINSTKPTAAVLTKAASATTAALKTPAASALKKASSTAAPATKTSSVATTKPSARTSIASAKPTMSYRPVPPTTATNAARRPTVPPKPTSAASLTGRRSASPSPDVIKATARVVSPAGSTGSTRPAVPSKPRASISDGIPAPSRRTSLGTKPPAPATAKPPLAARRTPGAASISSIKEVKEDTAVADLQKKLADAQKVLESNAEEAASLQSNLAAAKAELEAAVAEAGTKRAGLDELLQEKEALQRQLTSNSSLMDELQASHDAANKDLEDIKAKLITAEGEVTSKSEKIAELERQLQSVNEDNETAKRELESLRSASSANADVSAAAAIEHEALLKAHADLEAIKAETNALTAAHEAALNEAQAKIQELEGAAARNNELEKQIIHLKAEKEETANKLSEVEIEILELRESMETTEDREKQAFSQMKVLEEKIAKITADNEQALIESRRRDEAQEHALADARRQHTEAAAAAEAEQQKLTENMKTVEASLEDAVTRYEQALSMAKSAEEAHARKSEELAKAQADKERELSDEIIRLSSELAGQEAKYAEKVAAVKEEHDTLLLAAFEKAKNAAGDAHGQDLHELRTKSDAMIEQLNIAHKSFIESLKAEHEAELDAKSKSLDKTINNFNLELKATQDDLSKAKAALAAAIADSENLKSQIEVAEKVAVGAASNSSQEHAAEVFRLTRELSSASDETTALREVLEAQKGSMAEMSNSHTAELEMAAKSRAEEIMALRKSHELETMALVREKSDLISRVSDLEGEVATLQATVSAQSTASVKSNGAALAGSSTSVSREELQKLHEAHTLKMRDLEAQHERSMSSLQGDLESATGRFGELSDEVDRRTMEVRYLEADMEEKDDTITSLTDQISRLKEQLARVGIEVPA